MGGKPQNFDKRFWSKVHKTDTCWLWTGSLRNGYGQSSMLHKPLYAHRLIWEMTYGPIPPGLQVLHKCDVRNCVRPDHLFLGTQADNVHDRINKGRTRVVTKLTANDVRAIRASQEKTSVLALRFGVSVSQICNVCRRFSWKDLP
jgi:hypothetical protein